MEALPGKPPATLNQGLGLFENQGCGLEEEVHHGGVAGEAARHLEPRVRFIRKPRMWVRGKGTPWRRCRGSRRLFSLREDFEPALKIIAEDDITASAVAPVAHLENLGPGDFADAAKFVHNCEYRLFQRPDDAIIRGFDHRTEEDFVKNGNFFSNYEPIPITNTN